MGNVSRGFYNSQRGLRVHWLGGRVDSFIFGIDDKMEAVQEGSTFAS